MQSRLTYFSSICTEKNVGVIPVFIGKKDYKNCKFRVCACLTKTNKFQQNAVKFFILKSENLKLVFPFLISKNEKWKKYNSGFTH